MAARKARIEDSELCATICAVIQGQPSDLGGGHLRDDLTTTCAALSCSPRMVTIFYEYLFAKKERENIEDDELASFRGLAEVYAGLSEQRVKQQVYDKDLKELNHDN